MPASGDSAKRDQIVLFHLSDLHIGDSLMPSPDEFQGGLNSGRNPHDFRLLRPLAAAIDEARKFVGVSDAEPLNIVISGDLTQGGLDNDYATAFGLLHHRWQWQFGPPARARWIGLGLPRDTTHAVPGNHDHWRHPTFQTAYTRGLAPDFFEATPWRHPIESRNGTICLELFGVDSNSGLERGGGVHLPNLFAGGAVSEDEIQCLAKYLTRPRRDAKPGQAIVRALVCHHAFSSSGGLFDAHPLSEDSRIDLLERIAPHDMAVALTGHTHEFDVLDWPVAGRNYSLRELRCGTTLQGRKARPGYQGFWVHQIVSDGPAHCQWTAWKYQAAAGTFFVDVCEPVVFVIPKVGTSSAP